MFDPLWYLVQRTSVFFFTVYCKCKFIFYNLQTLPLCVCVSCDGVPPAVEKDVQERFGEEDGER